MNAPIVTHSPREVLSYFHPRLMFKSVARVEELVDELVKAKYIRRIATGNPKRPWQYVYHKQEKTRWQASAWETVKAALRADQDDHGKSIAHRDGARAVHFGEEVAKLPVGVLKLALAHLKATHGKRAVAGLQKILDHAEGKDVHPDSKAAQEVPPPAENSFPEISFKETAPKNSYEAVEQAKNALRLDPGHKKSKEWHKRGKSRLYVDTVRADGDQLDSTAPWNKNKANTGLYVDLKTGDVHSGKWAGEASKAAAAGVMDHLRRLGAQIKALAGLAPAAELPEPVSPNMMGSAVPSFTPDSPEGRAQDKRLREDSIAERGIKQGSVVRFPGKDKFYAVTEVYGGWLALQATSGGRKGSDEPRVNPHDVEHLPNTEPEFTGAQASKRKDEYLRAIENRSPQPGPIPLANRKMGEVAAGRSPAAERPVWGNLDSFDIQTVKPTETSADRFAAASAKGFKVSAIVSFAGKKKQYAITGIDREGMVRAAALGGGNIEATIRVHPSELSLVPGGKLEFSGAQADNRSRRFHQEVYEQRRANVGANDTAAQRAEKVKREVAATTEGHEKAAAMGIKVGSVVSGPGGRKKFAVTGITRFGQVRAEAITGSDRASQLRMSPDRLKVHHGESPKFSGKNAAARERAFKEGVDKMAATGAASAYGRATAPVDVPAPAERPKVVSPFDGGNLISHDMGNNETLKTGVTPLSDGTYRAQTKISSKVFKTPRGADKWLARRGFEGKPTPKSTPAQLRQRRAVEEERKQELLASRDANVARGNLGAKGPAGGWTEADKVPSSANPTPPSSADRAEVLGKRRDHHAKLLKVRPGTSLTVQMTMGPKTMTVTGSHVAPNGRTVIEAKGPRGGGFDIFVPSEHKYMVQVLSGLTKVGNVGILDVQTTADPDEARARRYAMGRPDPKTPRKESSLDNFRRRKAEGTPWSMSADAYDEATMDPGPAIEGLSREQQRQNRSATSRTRAEGRKAWQSAIIAAIGEGKISRKTRVISPEAKKLVMKFTEAAAHEEHDKKVSRKFEAAYQQPVEPGRVMHHPEMGPVHVESVGKLRAKVQRLSSTGYRQGKVESVDPVKLNPGPEVLRRTIKTSAFHGKLSPEQRDKAHADDTEHWEKFKRVSKKNAAGSKLDERQAAIARAKKEGSGGIRPEKTRTQIKAEVKAEPWTAQQSAYRAIMQADHPAIAEISGVQRARMSKRALKQYREDRERRTGLAMEANGDWASGIRTAMRTGKINMDTPGLSEDARQMMVEAAHNSNHQAHEEKVRARNAAKEAIPIRPGRVMHSRRWGNVKVAKLNAKSVQVHVFDEDGTVHDVKNVDAADLLHGPPGTLGVGRGGGPGEVYRTVKDREREDRKNNAAWERKRTDFERKLLNKPKGATPGTIMSHLKAKRGEERSGHHPSFDAKIIAAEHGITLPAAKKHLTELTRQGKVEFLGKEYGYRLPYKKSARPTRRITFRNYA